MQKILTNPKVEVIRPHGFINATNALAFSQILTTAISQNNCSILLVDFEEVQFIDSTGLMALISGLKLAENSRKRLSLCSISPAIKIVLELTQLDRAFEIFDSHAALISSLNVDNQTPKSFLSLSKS